MHLIFSYLSTINYFPLELAAGTCIYVVNLERKRNFCFRLFFAIIIAIFLIPLFEYFLFYGKDKIYFYNYLYAVFCLMITIIIILIIKFCFKIYWKETFFGVICAYLTEHMVYCVRILINYFFNSSVAKAGKPLYFLLNLILYIFSYFMFAKPMIKNGHYETGVFHSLWLGLVTLFMVLIMSIIAFIFDFLYIHAVYALFSCFFVLTSQVYQLKELNLQKELNFNKQLWAKHESLYTLSRENIDIINSKTHDLKHLVSALRFITDKNEKNQVINEMEKAVSIYETIIKTNNKILDTVLTEKSLICCNKKIDLQCMIDGKVLSFMDPIDLYTLFGNAMDNAIEGVETIALDSERYIGIQVYKRLQLIIIQIENPFIKNLKMKEGFPISSKENKDFHGFGLKSIQHIVKKYNGTITIKTDNFLFHLHIALPDEL